MSDHHLQTVPYERCWGQCFVGNQRFLGLQVTNACILIFDPFLHVFLALSAVEQGTQMLEMDCHLTHDGHVVVSHDENLLRQTGHNVTVSSLNAQVGGQITQDCWSR